jgi:hypothetical protein
MDVSEQLNSLPEMNKAALGRTKTREEGNHKNGFLCQVHRGQSLQRLHGWREPQRAFLARPAGVTTNPNQRLSGAAASWPFPGLPRSQG